MRRASAGGLSAAKDRIFPLRRTMERSLAWRWDADAATTVPRSCSGRRVRLPVTQQGSRSPLVPASVPRALRIQSYSLPPLPGSGCRPSCHSGISLRTTLRVLQRRTACGWFCRVRRNSPAHPAAAKSPLKTGIAPIGQSGASGPQGIAALVINLVSGRRHRRPLPARGCRDDLRDVLYEHFVGNQ